MAMRQRRVHRDAAAAVRLTEAGSLVQGSDIAVERCTAPILRVQAGGSIHATLGCNLFRSPYLRSIFLKCNGDSIVNRHTSTLRRAGHVERFQVLTWETITSNSTGVMDIRVRRRLLGPRKCVDKACRMDFEPRRSSSFPAH